MRRNKYEDKLVKDGFQGKIGKNIAHTKDGGGNPRGKWTPRCGGGGYAADASYPADNTEFAFVADTPRSKSRSRGGKKSAPCPDGFGAATDAGKVGYGKGGNKGNRSNDGKGGKQGGSKNSYQNADGSCKICWLYQT